MDFEFDKEIDALLRQTAQGGGFVSTQTALHLDADEISAFAENALPEKIRQRYTLHLADCDKCRKSLSSLIRLNSATENAVAVHAEEKHSTATAPIPWYRKLFAFPNLAYTLGALVLVFSGIAAYTVLRNINSPESAEVSQVTERQPNGKGMNSDGDATAIESYSSNMAPSNMMMSNAASMNSAANMSANASNPTMPSAPAAAAMNSNAAMKMRDEDSDKNLRAESKSLSPPVISADLAKTQDSIAAGAPPAPAKENDYQFDAETQKQQPNQTQNSIAQNQTQITPDSRNVQQQRAPMPTALSAKEKSKKVQESKDDKQEKLNETVSVGGKIFKRTDNVWYDSAYRGQATINITRGTNEYKKLGAGLRGIAENLGGTVVVVWKEKAYRIQ